MGASARLVTEPVAATTSSCNPPSYVAFRPTHRGVALSSGVSAEHRVPKPHSTGRQPPTQQGGSPHSTGRKPPLNEGGGPGGGGQAWAARPSASRSVSAAERRPSSWSSS